VATREWVGSDLGPLEASGTLAAETLLLGNTPQPSVESRAGLVSNARNTQLVRITTVKKCSKNLCFEMVHAFRTGFFREKI